MEGFLKALENGTEYDYITRNAHDMTKDELATIIKEYIYCIHSMGICDSKEDLIDAVYENLSY